MVYAMPVNPKFWSWKMIVISLVGLVLCAGLAMWVFAQREAQYVLEDLGGAGERKALILYHPSRDAHFTDELSLAVADGLRQGGYRVDRATLTGDTPGRPEGYSLLFVVSNTFVFTPDFPTLRYLKRATLRGIPAVGIIAGGGATARSEKMLAQSLAASGADVISMHAFWVTRPNDEKRSGGSNREIALQLARELGSTVASGQRALDASIAR